MQDFEENEAGMTPSPRRVGVILATVVAVAVVLFSLGVMVGKKAQRPGSMAVAPPAALPTETLVPLSPGDLPVKTASEAEKESSGEQAVPAEKLTFFDRLSGEKADEPALPKAPAEERSPPAPAMVKKAPVEAPAKVPDKPREKKKPLPSPAERLAALSQGGKWAVQVSSGTNSDWSEDYVRKLEKKGLQARSETVMLDGKRWYRIWIGQFADRDTAKEARGILQSGFDLKGNVVQGD